jgi:hypothetical protein
MRVLSLMPANNNNRYEILQNNKYANSLSSLSTAKFVRVNISSKNKQMSDQS